MSRRRSQKRASAYRSRLASLPPLLRALVPTGGRRRGRPRKHGLTAKEYAHRKRRRKIARASRQQNRRNLRG